MSLADKIKTSAKSFLFLQQIYGALMTLYVIRALNF